MIVHMNQRSRFSGKYPELEKRVWKNRATQNQSQTCELRRNDKLWCFVWLNGFALGIATILIIKAL